MTADTGKRRFAFGHVDGAIRAPHDRTSSRCHTPRKRMKPSKWIKEEDGGKRTGARTPPPGPARTPSQTKEKPRSMWKIMPSS